MVSILLENPRDWSLAAAALFDKPIGLVTGHSLKEDDKGLWKQISHLFTTRNAIAHRGEQPSPELARELVDAAVQATAWLESLAEPG